MYYKHNNYRQSKAHKNQEIPMQMTKEIKKETKNDYDNVNIVTALQIAITISEN